MIHELKTEIQYFKDVISGVKTFEIRKNDRFFEKGDLLALNEYDSANKCYTGNSCLVYIDYILRDKEYVKSDYVILSIKPCHVFKSDRPFRPGDLTMDYSVPLATVGVKEVE